MRKARHPMAVGMAFALSTGLLIVGSQALRGQQSPSSTAPSPRATTPPHDPAAEAQAARKVAVDRPEQRLNEHDRSGIFDPRQSPPSSPALDAQPEQGRIVGFDFGRDALDSKRPMQPFEEIMQMDIANKPIGKAAQQALLSARYDM